MSLIQDLLITYRVKTALANDPEIDAKAINVNTRDGIVTLLGNLRSEEEIKKAIQIAKSIEGVVDINPMLRP